MSTGPITESKEKRPRLSLSRAVLLALGLGVATGLFFGEHCAPLKVLGDVFIGLLQMTVLPYIVFALIANIGSLEVDGARAMARWGAATMLVLWGVTVAVILVMPLALPAFQSGSFFSSSLVEAREEIDFLELYIPVNPFRSLAENLIPAVVLFCIVLGAALIGSPGTDSLLTPMRVALDAMGRIVRWVAKLTPLGVFGLAAHAAGTLTLEQFGRLQGYVILYVAAAVLLSFVILPALVAAVTPFKMREVVGVSRDALITALATDNVFIVLPLLIEGAKDLFERHGLRTEATDREIDIAMPLAFPFPNAGRLLAMIFIPFAAWFVGRSLPLADYPVLIVSGVSSLFAKVTVAVPFLLDLVELPADLFNLFLLAGVLAGRFNSLAGAMHLFAFTLIVAAGVSGLVRLHRPRAMGGLLLTVAVLLVAIAGARLIIGRTLETLAAQGSVLDRMELKYPAKPARVLESMSADPLSLAKGESVLDRIRRRGALRVAFNPQRLPFCYLDSAGRPLGFDVEMAHRLADHLGVSLELAPLGLEKLDPDHTAEYFDLAMAGIPATPKRYRDYLLSDPYLEATLALVVRDHRRDDFDSLEEVRESDYGLAVLDEPLLVEGARELLPRARVVPTPDLETFFEGRLEGADAMLLIAEVGSAWTLLHPEFHVVTPWMDRRSVPLAYVIGGHDRELRALIDDWILGLKLDGTIDELYEHWVLGRAAEQRGPRWSIACDVLGWID